MSARLYYLRPKLAVDINITADILEMTEVETKEVLGNLGQGNFSHRPQRLHCRWCGFGDEGSCRAAQMITNLGEGSL